METDSLRGLTSAEVAARIAAGKTNDAHEQTSRSVKNILRANILTRFNALLMVLLVVVLLVGSPIDGLFGFVIIINSAIGIFQELRAKWTLDRLAILHAPTAAVLRDNALHSIPLKEVVLDDVIKLGIGDQVPADALVLRSEGLEIDESLLTGESDSVVKQTGDQILSGSIVVAGKGFARASAVGVDAYAHSITAQVKRFKIAESELVYGTNKLLGYISIVILVVAPLLIWGQIVRSGNSWQEATVRSIAAIVGMVPEGLVLLTSLAFMLAVLALVRRNVLVQQLPAVEGLARVNVICLDKTGTLTEGRIILDELVMLQPDLRDRAQAVLAAFAAEPNSPTLQALNEALNVRPLAQATYVVPFSSTRKWSAMSVSPDEHWIMGAPEMVWFDSDEAQRQQIESITGAGKRVLVVLQSVTQPRPDYLPADTSPVALVVLSEKVRSDARETLAFFQEQSVTLKVISGDSASTVGAIAAEVGLDLGQPVDARTLPTGTDELANVMSKHSAFGRVTPDQKRAMVRALQSQGYVVAMTGDGVNDALALKDADIGVAMGSGAQATKAIAELVLLNNRFAEMPHVLAEGRRVIANIERVANLFVIKNVYSLFLALAVTVAGLPYPFLPRHLSVLSALTIGIPAFFLSLAPNNQRYVPGFLRRVLTFAVPVGIMIALLIFGSNFIVTRRGGSTELASTVALCVVMLIGVWVLFCLARPLRLWKTTLILSVCGVFVALLAVPFTRQFLHLAVEWQMLLWVFSFGAVGIVAVELLWRRDRRVAAKDPRRVAGG